MLLELESTAVVITTTVSTVKYSPLFLHIHYESIRIRCQSNQCLEHGAPGTEQITEEFQQLVSRY